MGKISIKCLSFLHITFISKDAIHMKFLPDIHINSANSQMKRNAYIHDHDSFQTLVVC